MFVKLFGGTTVEIWEVQCGFTLGKGCADQIFPLQQITKICMKKVYCLFVYLEKASNKVDGLEFWNVLH